MSAADTQSLAPTEDRAAWAALIRVMTSAANAASEAGDDAAYERATKFRAHLVQVRDRWFSGEDSPVRTKTAEPTAPRQKKAVEP